MTNIIYQAHGNKHISKELIYSLYSFWATFKGDTSQIRVIVYTDDADFFKPYLYDNVIYRIIDDTQISLWAGDINFVHRIKIEIILDCFSKFDGNILYLDSDTIVTQNLQPLLSEICNAKSIMHLYEGQIDKPHNPIMTKMNLFLKKNFAALKITNQLPMWNAGVLGIDSENKYLVNKVLTLTDKIFAMYPKHVMEQFAFSYLLTTHTTVIASEEYIYHYWKEKREYRIAIDCFLDHLHLSTQIVEKVKNNQLSLKLTLPKPLTKCELRILKWKNSISKILNKIN